MDKRHKVSVAACVALLIPCFSPSVHAQVEHPAYLRALSELRASRSLLVWPDGGTLRDRERIAVRKIDAAIAEMKKASIDDGKNIDEHPPVDPRLPWEMRLRKSLELLAHAHQDCEREEDDPGTRGLQARVIKDLNEAEKQVWKAMGAGVR